MNRLLLMGFCCAVLLIRAEAAPVPSGRVDKAVTPLTMQTKASGPPSAKAAVDRSADQASISMAMNLAYAYSSSYQFRDVDSVQIYCSDRL